jgi:hypothetical protein
VVLLVADQVQLGVDEVLVLDTLDDAERAPGDAVVDPGDLPRPVSKSGPGKSWIPRNSGGLEVMILGLTWGNAGRRPGGACL